MFTEIYKFKYVVQFNHIKLDKAIGSALLRLTFMKMYRYKVYLLYCASISGILVGKVSLFSVLSTS